MVPSALELAREQGQGVSEALGAGVTQVEPGFGSKQGQVSPQGREGTGLDDQLPLPAGGGVAVILPGAGKGLCTLPQWSCTMD